MADRKATQNSPGCNKLQALTALPTIDPVMFFNSAAPVPDLADTASHRLSAALQLLKATTVYQLQDADDEALRAVSEAAYLLLSDGYDLFHALAFRPATN